MPVVITVTEPVVDPTDAEEFEPIGKDTEVEIGEEPKPEDNIENKEDLPEGTTYEYKDPVDTTTPGEKEVVVVVTYPDGTTDEVTVTVTVTKPVEETKDADKYEPGGKDTEVEVGKQPKPEDNIANKEDLPEGTKYEYKDPVDTTTPGEKEVVVIVTYPDGSQDEVTVTITVTKPDTKSTKPVVKPSKPSKPTTKAPKTSDVSLDAFVITLVVSMLGFVVLKKKKEEVL
ncbi:MAG: hypothetical protein GXY87_01850 [Tissierellia bacterium]|nr:hypothetical protein [Tissierellia bacterium]